jgi:hypothetical protein
VSEHAEELEPLRRIEGLRTAEIALQMGLEFGVIPVLVRGLGDERSRMWEAF